MRAMKKLIFAFLLLFAVLAAGMSGPGSSAEAGQRKLTLMVYMCGSDLESISGSASADVEEMIRYSSGSRDLCILVMLGGSRIRSASGYFLPDTTGIYEISGGRIRRIRETDPSVNMGDPRELSELLIFGKDNRPAEKYALVLWDHGGGPLEGICWDEIHDLDHLSLQELKQALEDAGLEEKLSWIGFDACLMSSLEVAGQLAPYAEYMIASQETEPASGWNYAFLESLRPDADGAETGRRIVDAYFEGKEDSGEILTMACTDLSAAEKVIEAMDPVFADLNRNLSEETFPDVSALRMSSAGFGKADPDQRGTGFDLVDVRDFVSHLEPTEKTEYLLSCLDQAVVYSRSNEKNAYGLTIYHPYANKTGFLEKWEKAYEEIRFSARYQEYVNTFGRILTGKALFFWKNLIPEAAARDPEGNYHFEMELTPEQAENLASAQVLILRDTVLKEENQCALVASCRAELSEGHLLQASWNGQALYVELEDGKLEGPIGFAQAEDGKRNRVAGTYFLNHVISGGQQVVFELEPEEEGEYPRILRTLAWDDTTQTLSSRLEISEDRYQLLMLADIYRTIPEDDGTGTFPAFSQWERNGSEYSAYTVDLPCLWKFRYHSEDFSQQLYAVFQLTDTQQNTVCSLPVPLPDPYRSVLQPLEKAAADTEGFHAELSCLLNSFPDRPSLEMEWTLRNEGDQKLSMMLADPVLNGSRIAETVISRALPPGETVHINISVDAYNLWGLDQLESIEGIFLLEQENGDKAELPFRFGYVSCDLSALRREAAPVLAETEIEGVALKLLQVDEDGQTGWNLLIYAENSGTENAYLGNVMLNGIHLNSAMDTLPPDRSRVYSVHELNFLSKTMQLKDTEDGSRFAVLEINTLQSMGQDQLEEIRIALTNSDSSMQHYLGLFLQLQELGEGDFSELIEMVQDLLADEKYMRQMMRSFINDMWGDTLFEAYAYQSIQSVNGGRGIEENSPVAVLKLKEPVPLGKEREMKIVATTIDYTLPPEELMPVSEADLPVLTENGSASVRLRRVTVGTGEMALLLEWVNRSDRWISIGCDSCTVNGIPAEGDRSIILPPDAVWVDPLMLSGSFGQEVREMTLTFTYSDTGGEYASESVALLPSASFAADADGGLWLNGQDFSAYRGNQ